MACQALNIYRRRACRACFFCLPFNFLLTGKVRNGGQVSHNNFGGFRLAAAGFTRDDDASVLSISFHRFVRRISNGKDVRRPFENLPPCKKKIRF